jgi:hypothetical protein
MMRIVCAGVIALGALSAFPSAAPAAPWNAQPAFLFRARDHGQPLVLRLTYERVSGVPHVGAGTLLVRGRVYRLEADTSVLATTADFVVRVYGHPTNSAPSSFSTLLGVFTLTWACHPSCANSTTVTTGSIFQGPSPGVPLPNGLTLSEAA